MGSSKQPVDCESVGKLAGMAVLLVGLQLVLCLQGIDFTDEGFWASLYQSIFADPASVKYGFMYWLTGLVGGCWLRAFGSWGLLGLRVLCVACQSLTLLLAWYVLRPHVRAVSLFWGFLIGIALIHNNILSFYANPFSALLLMAALACTWRYMRGGRSLWLAVAGAVVGASTFARTPNCLGVAIMTVPLLSALIHGKWSWRAAVRQVAVFVCGFLAGTLATVGVMVAMGHGTLFADALRLLSEMSAGKGDQAHHSLGVLVALQLRVYAVTAGLAAVGLVAVAVGRLFFGSLRGWIPERTVDLLLRGGAAATVACFGFVFVRYAAMGLVYYATLALGFSLAAYESLRRHGDRERALVWWGAVLPVLVLPLGSNVPHFIGRYALWLLLPLTVEGVLRLSREACPAAKANRGTGWARWFGGAVLASVWVASSMLLWRQCYRDSQHRSRLIAPLAVERAKGILTTPERAAVLADLLGRLAREVKPGDRLLVYADMPMIQYLTDTRSPVGNAWPKLYAPEVFGRKLEASAQGPQPLPAVVRQRTNLGMREWPTEKVAYLDAPSNQARTRLLDRFLAAHGYVQVWETEHFDFWLPPHSGR